MRRDGERTRISVDRGRVLASWWGGSRELGAGEQGMFPPEGVAVQVPAIDASETVAPRATAEEEPAPVPVPPPLAPAVAVRRAPSAAPVRAAAAPTPEALFALADRARATGQPQAAVARLREIVDRFPRDPHAPMAAFTEGRLCLESLGRPRQAAAAFERGARWPTAARWRRTRSHVRSRRCTPRVTRPPRTSRRFAIASCTRTANA